MHLYRSGVEGECLNLDAYDLFQLQLLEHAVQHAILGPPIHASVDRMPPAKAFRKPAPLASLLSHVQNSVEYLQVRQTYIAALHRETVLDARELLFRDLHLSNILHHYCFNSVNTPCEISRNRLNMEN